MAEETQAAKKEVSLLLEARNLLKVTPPGTRADILRSSVDRFAEANDLFKIACTRSALRDLIGSATLLLVALSSISNPPDIPPKADAAREESGENAVAPKVASR